MTKTYKYSFIQPRTYIFGSLFPPVSLFVIVNGLAIFILLHDHDAKAAMTFSLFSLAIIALGWLRVRKDYVRAFVRPKFEAIVVDDIELSHIDLHGKEDFRCGYSEVLSISAVILVMGDVVPRWTVANTKGQQFELRRDVDHFLDLIEELRLRLPTALGEQLANIK